MIEISPFCVLLLIINFMQIFPSLKHSFNLVCAAKMNETTFVGRRLLKNTRSFSNRNDDS